MSFSNTALGGRRWPILESPTDYFWWRHHNKVRRWNGDLPTVAEITDVSNLLQVFYALKHRGGKASGIDGLSYDDYSSSEIAQTLRVVAEAIKTGTYRPHPCREVRIAKKDGGRRVLRLGIIVDRVIAAALNIAMGPYWEKLFLSCSHGFLPNRGVWTLLAALEVQISRSGNHVLVSEDICRAFDSVKIDRLISHHQQFIKESVLMNFINTVLRGSEGERRTIGIDQGNAYSPTALNLYLHMTHDLIIERIRHIPFRLRYADNLVYLSRNETEGCQIIEECKHLLQAGELLLKGEKHNPINLNMGAKVTLLGYIISLNKEKLIYTVSKDSWQTLRDNLNDAHQNNNPPKTAHETVKGWLNWCGPAYSEQVVSHFIKKVTQILTESGFSRIISTESIQQVFESSWNRWQECLHKAFLQPGRIPNH